MGARNPNRVTRGAAGFGSILVGGVLIFANAGRPADAVTGAGVAAKSAICLDTTNGRTYRNVGTKPVPVWQAIGEQEFVDVTITAAQVLALNATPRTLVSAPGADKALIFEGARIIKPAGTAYGGIAAGEDLALKYTDGSGLEVGQVELTGFLDQATAQVRYVRPHTAASGISSFVPVVNAAIVAHLLVGEIITGDSDLKYRVYYRIVPTA